MNKTGIEYLDFTWNYYTGCENHRNGVCGGGGQQFRCWAKAITKRFPKNFPYGFEPTVHLGRLEEPLHRKKPSRIGVSFMGDLFGDWMWSDNAAFNFMPGIRRDIFQVVEACPQHTFLFLTRCYWNLIRWSPFPDNCQVGVTATGYKAFNEALDRLKGIEAKVKFISIEPLLEAIPFYMERLAYCGINRLIIGAQTKSYKPPKIKWVQEIVEAADRAGVAVFLKDNLRPLLVDALTEHQIDREPFFVKSERSPYGWNLRQEMPNK